MQSQLKAVLRARDELFEKSTRKRDKRSELEVTFQAVGCALGCKHEFSLYL